MMEVVKNFFKVLAMAAQVRKLAFSAFGKLQCFDVTG